MKILQLLLLSCISAPALAQTCEKTQIRDSILMDPIGEFIINCAKYNEMYKSMEVIHMAVFPNSGKAERRISLWIELTDRFKDNPPQ